MQHSLSMSDYSELLSVVRYRLAAALARYYHVVFILFSCYKRTHFINHASTTLRFFQNILLNSFKPSPLVGCAVSTRQSIFYPGPILLVLPLELPFLPSIERLFCPLSTFLFLLLLRAVSIILRAPSFVFLVFEGCVHCVLGTLSAVCCITCRLRNRRLVSLSGLQILLVRCSYIRGVAGVNDQSIPLKIIRGRRSCTVCTVCSRRRV
jgi:hypothetical protein